MFVDSLVVFRMFLRVMLIACLGSSLIVAGIGIKAEQKEKKQSYFVLADILLIVAIISYLALRNI